MRIAFLVTILTVSCAVCSIPRSGASGEASLDYAADLQPAGCHTSSRGLLGHFCVQRETQKTTPRTFVLVGTLWHWLGFQAEVFEA